MIRLLILMALLLATQHASAQIGLPAGFGQLFPKVASVVVTGCTIGVVSGQIGVVSGTIGTHC